MVCQPTDGEAARVLFCFVAAGEKVRPGTIGQAKAWLKQEYPTVTLSNAMNIYSDPIGAHPSCQSPTTVVLHPRPELTPGLGEGPPRWPEGADLNHHRNPTTAYTRAS